MKTVPLQLFERGYTPLVSVVPPNAPLSPSSKLSPSQLGKSPGIKYANGTWGGYGWLRHETTEADVRQWSQDGANIGLLAAQYPAVDVDCTDPALSAEIVAIVKTILGPAPLRVGKAPKALLMYRLDGAPFSRTALLIYPEGKPRDGDTQKKPVHLVEVLGQGRQYLIYGQHPSGSAYTWDGDLPEPAALTGLSLAKVEQLFDELTVLLEIMPGMVIERIGDGRVRDAVDAPEQHSLVAPSLELLQEAVSYIPNGVESTREQYVRIGYAIRAAWPESEEDAFQIFAEWASKHHGSDRVEGNPDTWRSDWRRMKPPFSVGYSFLAELARQWGFNDAKNDFDAIDDVAEKKAAEEREEKAAALSDKWCADRVIEQHGHVIRFVAAEEHWYVWDQGRWTKDAVNLAQHLVASTMEKLSAVMARHAGTPQETKEALAQARRLGSAYARDSVLKIVQADPRIAIRPESFDSDPWLLNTPGGIVDLRTGETSVPTADTLCSKITRVTPDFEAPAPNWTRFLIEACGDNVQLIKYLQRVAGYCLTGLTTEQCFWMVWGPGGNGKSVYLNALAGVMGDYARTAPMDTFTASQSDRHPTEVAMLLGARLVSATETQAGKRWDEAKVKSLTGGDMISARFMRQDFFTYLPQFKLLFVGNHKPELRDVDPAMRRRIHMVPFTITPKRVDTELSSKLREEWPAILAWAIRGCLDWQREGLQTPTVVLAATEEYLIDQDSTQRWLEECTLASPGSFVSLEHLFESWREWAGRNGEHPGVMRSFAARLVVKQFRKHQDATTKRHGFVGLSVHSSALGGL